MPITFITPIKPHLSHKEAFPMANEVSDPRSTNISEFLRKESTGASFGNSSTPLISSRRGSRSWPAKARRSSTASPARSRAISG